MHGIIVAIVDGKIDNNDDENRINDRGSIEAHPGSWEDKPRQRLLGHNNTQMIGSHIRGVESYPTMR